MQKRIIMRHKHRSHPLWIPTPVGCSWHCRTIHAKFDPGWHRHRHGHRQNEIASSRARALTHTHARTHSRARTHTHTHTHTQTHTHTHTHTLLHTKNCSSSKLYLIIFKNTPFNINWMVRNLLQSGLWRLSALEGHLSALGHLSARNTTKERTLTANLSAKIPIQKSACTQGWRESGIGREERVKEKDAQNKNGRWASEWERGMGKEGMEREWCRERRKGGGERCGKQKRKMSFKCD